MRLPWATARVRPYHESLSGHLYMEHSAGRVQKSFPAPRPQCKTGLWQLQPAR